MFQTILSSYGLSPEACTVAPFGSGLINHTWRVSCAETSFILQRLNTNVFKNPWAIAENIERIGNHLATHHPGYLFVRPLETLDGRLMLHRGTDGFLRLLPFVGGSHTVDTVASTGQAFEAAAQFGKFTRLLRTFDPAGLATTLPHFHNLNLRYRQFDEALASASPQRLANSQELISFLQSRCSILERYQGLTKNGDLKIRVTHHDTKISNVLFDERDKGLCVIDLDTVMPGYFLSDVGDMLRTYLSPVSEEEADFSKIEVRDDYFAAVAEGYLSQMVGDLSQLEIAHFVFAGKMMVYMQALRFLTDYLNNDVYYGQRYEGHNFVRAGNQTALLQRLEEKEDVLLRIVHTLVKAQ